MKTLQKVQKINRVTDGTLNLSLLYARDEKCTDPIIGYVASDWTGDKVDRKSTSGYFFKFLGCSVSWASKKQHTMPLLSTESEFVALSMATSEACWLCNLIHRFSGSQRAAVFHEGNVSVISLWKNLQFNHKQKHINVKKKFIRENVFTKKVMLKHNSTNEQ
ncbi:uncharacterized protein LOC126481837 [Schistocerca serialis cubense]|uniref:uncharacterized protein LOC126481837 n=1 Tax=Schistocerca serialis cubense TaxID=2023355 RepID=UPI00214E0E0B|nr:uncharacterized protein LOC126481837 [Schistocerca serialis cubense]